MKTRKYGALVSFMLLTLFVASAHGTDLAHVYKEALTSDPAFLAAQADMNAAKEAYPQAFANVLPNISAVSNSTTTSLNALPINSANYPQQASTSTVSYNSNLYTVTLTQPVFNYAAFVGVSQANDAVKAAVAKFHAEELNLITRTANLYFKALLAEDVLRFTRAEKAAISQQLNLAKMRFKVGLETNTGVSEAEASFDAVRAREISAQNDLVNAKQALMQVTGFAVKEVAPLSKQFKLQSPKPENEQRWVDMALKNNWELQAAVFAESAAKKQIKINYAGHLPTLTAIGTYAKENNASAGTLNTESSALGLQVNIPLYSGGAVSSQVRQAQFLYVKAAQEAELARRGAVIKTRQFYHNVLADISRVNADKQTVRSMQNVFNTTNVAYKAGTRTMVNVLDVQQNVYKAKAALAQDSYQYIFDTLMLKSLAGNLSDQDIFALNKWLQQ